MWKEITKGIKAYLQAFSYIHEHKLWNYLFFSGLISFFVCLLIFGTAYYSSDIITDKIIRLYPFEWGKSVIQNAGYWIIFLLLLIICLFLLKYIIIIALGPLLSILSEKIESIEKPGMISPPLNIKNLASGFLRGLKINVRNIFMELWYTILLLIMSLVPLLSVISGPLIVFVQSYYAGFGNYDLYLERHLSYRESIKFLRMRRTGSATNGIIFLTLLAIPVLGWVFAPFLSVVAASLVLSRDPLL